MACDACSCPPPLLLHTPQFSLCSHVCFTAFKRKLQGDTISGTTRFEAPEDEEIAKRVNKLNGFDLNSKGAFVLDVTTLRPYYHVLLERYVRYWREVALVSCASQVLRSRLVASSLLAVIARAWAHRPELSCMRVCACTANYDAGTSYPAHCFLLFLAHIWPRNRLWRSRRDPAHRITSKVESATKAEQGTS